MPPVRAVLFGLDGVIRHFDLENVAAIERTHGVRPGAIEAIAFAPQLLDQVTTGAISRHEWLQRIGGALGFASWAPSSIEPRLRAKKTPLTVAAISTSGKPRAPCADQ